MAEQAHTPLPPPKELMKDSCHHRYTLEGATHGGSTSEQVLHKRDYGPQMSPCQRWYYYNIIMITCWLSSYHLVWKLITV